MRSNSDNSPGSPSSAASSIAFNNRIDRSWSAFAPAERERPGTPPGTGGSRVRSREPERHKLFRTTAPAINDRTSPASVYPGPQHPPGAALQEHPGRHRSRIRERLPAPARPPSRRGQRAVRRDRRLGRGGACRAGGCGRGGGGAGACGGRRHHRHRRQRRAQPPGGVTGQAGQDVLRSTRPPVGARCVWDEIERGESLALGAAMDRVPRGGYRAWECSPLARSFWAMSSRSAGVSHRAEEPAVVRSTHSTSSTASATACRWLITITRRSPPT